MGLWKSIKKFLFDPVPVSKISDLEQGRVSVEGVVRFDREKLISPVKGIKCVAFYYKASYLTGSRGGGLIQRKLREAGVYIPFNLEMEDGTIKAVPVKSDQFTAEDHRVLTGRGYEGFKAKEDVITPGTRVRLWGKLKKEDGELVVRFNKVEILQKEDKKVKRTKKKKKGGRG